jgi:serine/threonine protein kinase
LKPQKKMEQQQTKILLNSLTDLEVFHEKIGTGSFAQVKLVKHKPSGLILALKEIDLSQSLNYKEESKLILREINIHKK